MISHPEQEQYVLLCGGRPCRSTGCRAVKERMLEELRGHQLDIPVKEVGCMGNCELGPTVVVYPGGTVYQRVRPSDARAIVEEHILAGRPVERLMYRDPVSGRLYRTRDGMPFYRGQVRVALRNVGVIEPILPAYMSRHGYAALAHALTRLTPEQVIEEVKKSGLRGRGGGGFPTGRKWEMGRAARGERKYVICNADEGDPGAFMDRSILEGDPHSILEGMALAAYAIGARQGYIYVRAEYPLAVERCESAIAQAREGNLLGPDILRAGFDFDVEIRVGAGAYVCGEETALLRSVEGSRGDPSPRPPFPVSKGLWEYPTVINNVETLANVAPIILQGSDWFRTMGTERSPGTKVFALAGKIRHTGLVEVPMGTSLRTIIHDLGGGMREGHTFKAAQTGGPSGGCLTEEHLDISMEYDTLQDAGSIMGSGGLIIMDDTSCMVDLARYFMDFNQDESCGKCTPCRVGTKRMLEILDRITQGEGVMEDLDRLEKLGALMRRGSLCGLGRSAPNPVLSTLLHFRGEYEAHIRDKVCPAGVCPALVERGYHIDPDLCRACGLCARSCPSGAIRGERGKGYSIVPELCALCDACAQVCPFEAVKKGAVQRVH